MASPIFTRPFRRVFAANVMSDLSFNVFVHFPGFLKELGAGEALIGLIASVAVLTSVSLRPGVGQAMDRRGRLPIVRAAAVTRLAVALLFFTIGSIGPWVFVVRAVYGISTAVVFTGLFTYANDLMPPERRTQAIALYGLSGLVPGMFGAALGDVIISRFGYAGMFVAVAAFDGLAIAVISRLRPLPRTGTFVVGIGFRRLVRLRTLRSVWLLTVCFGLVFGSLQTFMRTFVDASGVGTVGLFFFAYSTTAVVLRLSLSWAPDRFGFSRILFPVVLAQALGIALLSGVDSTPRFFVAAMLAGAGHAFLFPILGRLAVERSPVEDRGSASGLYTAMIDVAVLVAAPVLGVVIEQLGYPSMFRVVAATILLSAVGFAILERRVAPALAS